jgi:hypothetical protein
MWTPGVYPASSHTGITNYIKDRNAFDFISAHQRLENPLFFKENTRMFYGDAKKSVGDLIPKIA